MASQETQPQWGGGWISWSGGKCPVDPDTLVIVQLKGESQAAATTYTPRRASYWNWARGPRAQKPRIVAYREAE